MNKQQRYDAIIIGSGPNGLSAAIVLALAGRSVLVVEARATIGGGSRSQELTLPGFVHDVCSAVHPLGLASPFFQTLPLERYGLEWIQPEVPLAHPLDDGSAVLLERSIVATAAHLGVDGERYERLMRPFIEHWELIVAAFLAPLQLTPFLHPWALAPAGLAALQSARGLAERSFKGERARALFAGISAHSMLPLEQLTSAAVGLVLATAGHVSGWPVPKGGSQRIVNALAAYLQALGGEIVTGEEVTTVEQLPPARVILGDITPRQLLNIAGHRLSPGYIRALKRFRYGPGSFKIDYALSGPVPWMARDCLRAGTVHLGGTLSQIATSERLMRGGEPAPQPYVLVAQQSLIDPSRAPEGKQTLWAYCHVPHGSTFDMTTRIEDQIERFAPGFRDQILARSVISPADLERYNPNYIGGDINGGSLDLWQLFTRPTLRPIPYSTSAPDIYLCSSSTPPGGGVHGLCGYYAARAVLNAGL
ncbi:phytoene desaturase family protein [Tengunoibacter tsumagoiensis]|uniref:FAD-dependent oxidoreductase n=1 Tax=Tengunoibacter tsumagoiensis TaxID=2014871 RepID=A0A402A2B4_9CHLR|nr:NAD(P)/FAD-dependent oxidoreductase [Tengunoibacter tsumagoiensis]GCE13283.1 FAD-dependent oxidoreductase [Tengunoibacter tsumagoiensis]